MVDIAPVPASPSDTRRLVAMGWLPDDQGLWSLNGAVPCTAAVALVVADVLDKMPKKSTNEQASKWWNHLSGTLLGTTGTGILTGIAAALIANPPPEMGLTPTAVTWMKWGLGVAGVVLLGTQVPRSINAVKDPPKESPK